MPPKMAKQVLGRAISRVKKALPGSPQRKLSLVKKLAESMGLIAHEHSKRRTDITNDILDQARQFYQHDDIARFMPGKQDVL